MQIVLSRDFQAWRPLCSFLCLAILMSHSNVAVALDRNAFQNGWVARLINFSDPRWEFVDLLFIGECSVVAYEKTAEFLRTPESKEMTFEEIQNRALDDDAKHVKSLLTDSARAFMSAYVPTDDPVLQCQPTGMLRTAVNPLPLRIAVNEDTITFRYEYWNLERTVYMDGRTHPANPESSLLGHSIGRFEGDALVVETLGIDPALYGPPNVNLQGLRNSAHARVTERYEVTSGGERLNVVVTINDPETLTKPLVLRQSWLSEPDLELQHFECTPVGEERLPATATEK